VLTFGIAPVVLVYAWGFEFIRPEHNTLTNVSILILFMYLLCGTFRLARFNLQSSKSAEILTSKSKKDFVGLPIPAAAGVIAAMIHFHPERMKGRTDSEDLLIAWSLVALIGLLGFLMVSRIRYSSFKSVGTGRLPTYPVLLIAGIGMSIWLYSQWVLLLFAAGYLLYGLVGAIIRNTVLRNRQAASA